MMRKITIDSLHHCPRREGLRCTLTLLRNPTFYTPDAATRTVQARRSIETLLTSAFWAATGLRNGLTTSG